MGKEKGVRTGPRRGLYKDGYMYHLTTGGFNLNGWKTKALIQNIISLFPRKISNELYYQVQRHFGRLKDPAFDLIDQIKSGVKILHKIKNHGRTSVDKIFFEVGTGTAPITALVYWLGGCRKTITIDLNPYMRKELIEERICYLNNNESEIITVFDTLLDKERFSMLLDFYRKRRFDLGKFLKLCHIEYIAPGDAAKTNLPDESIDYHTSRTVYEHIPENTLKKILQEGNRIMKKGGLFINLIDYSDHFSHTDKKISGANFYRYNDEEWNKYTHNRFYYVNRLRHDDYINLFETVGHQIIETEKNNDAYIKELLETGKLRVDKKFQAKQNDILAIMSSWFITQK